MKETLVYELFVGEGSELTHKQIDDVHWGVIGKVPVKSYGTPSKKNRLVFVEGCPQKLINEILGV